VYQPAHPPPHEPAPPAVGDDTELLRRFLKSRDAACPACGYSLRGLQQPSCPECNNPLSLTVSLAEPRTALLLWAMLPCAAVGGLALLFAGFVATFMLTERVPRAGEFFWLAIYPPCAAAVLLTPVIFLMTKRGQRWFATSPRGRAVLVTQGLGTLAAIVLAVWTVWLVVDVIL